MNKRIPLTVSSGQVPVSDDAAPLQLTAYANAGVTSEKAPVLVAVKSERQMKAEEFAQLMVRLGGEGTEAQARLVLNAICSVFYDLVDKYGAITIGTPFGTVQTFIAGTIENAQDQPDPETNYPFLGVILPEPFRKAFAALESYVPTEACPVSLKRVRDKATGKAGIRGGNPFYLDGIGMSFGGEGEKLELLDGETGEKIADASVDPEQCWPVQLVCSLASGAAVPVGRHKLRLTTLAGGDTTLWPVDIAVEVVEPIVPPEPLVTSSDGFVKVMSIDEDPIPALGSFTVRGENVGYKSGDAEQGLPDHGLMGASATVDGQPLTWHCTAFDDEHASEATFQSDGCEEPLEPGEYTAALTLNYAVDDGTGVSHLEPLVIENVKFKVSE